DGPVGGGCGAAARGSSGPLRGSLQRGAAPAAPGRITQRARNDVESRGSVGIVGWWAVLRVFVLDAHSIYRRGLVACLETMDGVVVVGETDSVEAARADSSVAEADVLLVDHELPGGDAFLREVRESTDAKLIVCSSRADEAEVLSVIQAGAVGYL